MILALLLTWRSVDANEISYVSIINLIATPEKYSNKTVNVVGYAVIEFENIGLYLSENDATRKITQNSLYLDIEDNQMEKCIKGNHKYILVQGVFDPNARGHGSFQAGGIKKIERFEEW